MKKMNVLNKLLPYFIAADCVLIAITYFLLYH